MRPVSVFQPPSGLGGTLFIVLPPLFVAVSWMYRGVRVTGNADLRRGGQGTQSSKYTSHW